MCGPDLSATGRAKTLRRVGSGASASAIPSLPVPDLLAGVFGLLSPFILDGVGAAYLAFARAAQPGLWVATVFKFLFAFVVIVLTMRGFPFILATFLGLLPMAIGMGKGSEANVRIRMAPVPPSATRATPSGCST